MKKNQKGFTLVELLVVIGILAVLTAVVLVAVNPVRQFAQARDTQRRADVNTISAAVVAYLADPNNPGVRSLGGLGITGTCTGVGAAPQTIGTTVGATYVDLTSAGKLVPVYVAAMPVDPQNGTQLNTGYTVCVTDATSNRFTVAAVISEVDPAVTISVTR